MAKGKETRKEKKVINKFDKESSIMDNEKKGIIHDKKNLHRKKMP